MYFKYFTIDKNYNEIYSIIEAKDKEDAIEKLRNNNDILYLIEIKEVTGGTLGLQLAIQQNLIKMKTIEIINKIENSITEWEIKRQKRKLKEKEQKKKRKIKRNVELSIREINSLDFIGKIKFLVSSKPEKLEYNFKLLKLLKEKNLPFLTDEDVAIIEEEMMDLTKKEKIKKTFIKKRKNVQRLNFQTEEELIDFVDGTKDVNFNEIEIQEQRFPLGKGKIKNKDILMFTKQLQIMVRSDISITNALSTLGKSDNEKMNNMLNDMRDEILNGNTLSQAMRYYPQYFDTTYLALIQIGERSSSFQNVLGEIVDYKEKADKIQRKIKTAGIYPIILGLLLSVMGILGSLFFIPIFEEMYESSDMPIPALTQAIFTLAGNLHIVIPVIFLIAFIIRLLYKRIYRIQVWWDAIWHKAKLKLPIIRNISTILYMYNFSSTLSIMLNNDIRLQSALMLAKETINNMYVQEEIDTIEKLVSQEGLNLSNAIGLQENFDNLIEIITMTGEKTGSFSKSFKDIADYYSKEIDSVIDATMEIIEPLSIIVLGAIILPIAVGLYMPMLEMTTGGFLDA